MIYTDGIMMIEPSGAPSEEPLIDEATRKMTAAWRTNRACQVEYRKPHICSCGAESDRYDHWIVEGATGRFTNSLCIHYLAYHRQDVPASELAKVMALNYGHEEPTRMELVKPIPRRVIREVGRNVRGG